MTAAAQERVKCWLIYENLQPFNWCIVWLPLHFPPVSLVHYHSCQCHLCTVTSPMYTNIYINIDTSSDLIPHFLHNYTDHKKYSKPNLCWNSSQSDITDVQKIPILSLLLINRDRTQHLLSHKNQSPQSDYLPCCFHFGHTSRSHLHQHKACALTVAF